MIKPKAINAAGWLVLLSGCAALLISRHQPPAPVQAQSEAETKVGVDLAQGGRAQALQKRLQALSTGERDYSYDLWTEAK